MEIINNLGGIFRFTYGWVRQSEAQRLYVRVFLMNMVAVLVALLGFAFLFGGVMAAALPSSYSSSADASMSKWFSAFTGLGIAGVIVGFLLMVLAALISTYYNVLPTFSALRAKGLETVQWDRGKLLGYICFVIVDFFYTALSLLDKRGLAVVVAFWLCLLLAVFSPMHAAFGLLTVVLAFAYFIVIIYNAMRLYAGLPIYLSKGMSITESLGQSWELTKDKAFAVFGLSLVLGLTWAIPIMVVAMGVELVMQVVVLMGFVGLAVSGPGAILVGVILFVLLYMAFRMLVNVLMTFVMTYLMVGIYDQLLQEKSGAKSAPMPRAPRPSEAAANEAGEEMPEPAPRRAAPRGAPKAAPRKGGRR
ncbi:Membrane domain of glycerophosphoryl diester phosphodiesterase [Candidatus Burarchaeum australiense]|nr:Membrane domain of glycerophosphoryl diester phosphodiesterase [Candidatus Burarchaeum australiense]